MHDIVIIVFLNHTVKAGGAQHQEAGGSQHQEAGGDWHLDGIQGRVCIEAVSV